LEIELQNAARFSGFFSSSFPSNPDFKPLEFDAFKNESEREGVNLSVFFRATGAPLGAQHG
jgi:hypothetical protein